MVIPFGMGQHCRSVARNLAGGMEQDVFQVLPVKVVAMVIIINFPISNVVLGRLVGEQTHVAWQELPVIIVAMEIVMYGSGLVITATNNKTFV